MTSPSARVIDQMFRLSREISAAGVRATNAAALEAKKIHVQEIRRAVGTDLRMSGVGRSGARVNVRYMAARSESNPVAVISAVGPLHLVERPVKPHSIRPRGRKKAVLTPAGPRRSVMHPGVRSPKRPWQIGRGRARPTVSKMIQRQYGSAFARGLR